jgi:inosose dehydratase
MIRWAYGINQFNPQFDDFVRRREHQRALRVISAAGFDGVELQCGSGRWEPLGNPQQIEANFGSLDEFGRFVRDAALDGVSSWLFDPFQAFGEDLSQGTDPSRPECRELLVEHALWFGRALVRLGGSVLVATPTRPAGGAGALSRDELEITAQAWNEVGAALQEEGVTLALNFGFLSALRIGDALEKLIGLTDPAVVGFAIDTAEFTIAGIDPVVFYERHHDRICHVQLKNAAATDGDEEFLKPAGEYDLLRAGGDRRIPRWFTELGSEPQLVDSAAFVQRLRNHDYGGWVVVESDLTPHQATSVMLNGWEVQHVLRPILVGP